MKRYFWILAAALVSLAACDKNELQNGAEETPGSPAVTYIRALGGEDASKALIDNTTAAFTWSEGDTIAVYTTSGYKISDPLASGDGAGTNNATFVFSGANAVTEADRADFAFYPASLVHGIYDGIKSNCAAHHTAADLVVRLRKEYSLSEVSGDKAPTPMIATNAPDGDLSFKALCPLIRITVRNIPKQTHRIDFTFDGENVYGEFNLTSVTPGTSSITKAADTDMEFFIQSSGCLQTKGFTPVNETITVGNLGISAWTDELVINLPVPVGNYGKIIITARDNSGNAILSQTVWPNGTSNWTGTRKASKKLTAALPVFTMGGGKKGIFAPGNLQYTSGAWRFAPGQYERLGAGAQSDDSRDLFGWGTGSGTDRNKTSTDDAEYSTFNDWGANAIYGYSAGTWRTPTNVDWSTVFTRSVTNIFVPAVIETPTIYGILIFPDDYSAPAGLSISFTAINDHTSTPIPYTSNKISDADWLLLESVGCVFLPYAGEREGTTPANYSDGVYWSSTESTATTASTVFFQSASFGWNNPVNKHRGVAVRLVRDMN